MIEIIEIGRDDDQMEQVFVDDHEVAKEAAVLQGNEAEEDGFAGDNVGRFGVGVEAHVVFGEVEGSGWISADGHEGHAAEGADAGVFGNDAIVHGALITGDLVGRDGGDSGSDPGVEISHFHDAIDRQRGAGGEGHHVFQERRRGGEMGARFDRPAEGFRSRCIRGK